ncbi:FHA domain-containing protein [Vitiosangium sp. GDMCC 1.1324]|uniref:FHA domain-containing protein n=1 Tax=Vitiosangium sp. (strain GDMCC 1.1324) TaxID=2138576 RepID=UPI000D392185|nr:FHA domain-containing protein [Vitiosangium sp. GDMCC 1.1324]PTL77450.1 nuclease PIN [Vitiosangium sp. GDMCC 1.1324]
MSPPNPKRPPRSPRPPGDTASRPEPEVELPFDDDEVAPLQADDPRPQRVPQYPAGPRRRPRRGPGGSPREPRDRELPARFDSGEYEDPGHSPAFLYVERGPGAGQLLPIKQGVLVLGRASTSDLRLQHPSISRRHAQLTRRGDRLSLKDLGSQNGTYINRARLTSELDIRSGDEIALGNALLRVRGPGAAPTRPRSAASQTVASLRVGMSTRRIVLLAAATGSLVAVFLTLAAVRLIRPRTEPSHPVEDVEVLTVAEAPPEVSPGATSDEVVRAESPSGVEKAPAPGPTAPATPGSKVRSASGTHALSAQAIAGSGSPKRQEAGVRAKVGAGSGKAAATKPAPAEDAQVPDAEAEAEALARYESGNVESALAVARRAHLENLSATLARFQNEWSAGNAALAARDSASAIQHLTVALELDQQLSKGWGTFAPRIRKALEQAYLQADGKQQSAR